MIAFEDITLTAESLPEVVDFAAVFGNDRPVELEIGCGKGAFLLREAQAHPERNYLGIEWANEFYKFTADRMARWGMTNVRIMRTDARQFVITRLPEACLDALHVYHPDPWPKKRHHKRRLFNETFVSAAIRVLKPGGRWAIQTDHADYFQVMCDVTRGRPELTPIEFTESTTVDASETLGTNFEIKYRREGRAIYRLAFRRESTARTNMGESNQRVAQ